MQFSGAGRAGALVAPHPLLPWLPPLLALPLPRWQPVSSIDRCTDAASLGSQMEIKTRVMFNTQYVFRPVLIGEWAGQTSLKSAALLRHQGIRGITSSMVHNGTVDGLWTHCQQPPTDAFPVAPPGQRCRRRSPHGRGPARRTSPPTANRRPGTRTRRTSPATPG